MNTIGLMPAAGRARRVAPLPCSKEVFPLDVNGTEGRGPTVACAHLLRALHRAGVRRAYMIIRKGKWDIPAYLEDGAAHDVRLAYVLTRVPYGVPFTLDSAYPFICEARVAFGFPDILFRPVDAFARVMRAQADGGADLVLGLFPTERPHTADVVAHRDGRVTAIHIKPEDTALRDAWVMAVWTPAFTRYLHAYLDAIAAPRRERLEAGRDEVHLGEVFQAAIEEGLAVEAVSFPEGRYLDIGTPEALHRAQQGAW